MMMHDDVVQCMMMHDDGVRHTLDGVRQMLDGVRNACLQKYTRTRICVLHAHAGMASCFDFLKAHMVFAWVCCMAHITCLSPKDSASPAKVSKMLGPPLIASSDQVGATVGVSVGMSVGAGVGVSVASVGDAVGARVGVLDGPLDGQVVGSTVG